MDKLLKFLGKNKTVKRVINNVKKFDNFLSLYLLLTGTTFVLVSLRTAIKPDKGEIQCN